MPVAIVSDTCHYLTPELAAERGIHVVSLYVHWGDEVMRESEITNYGDYYERLRTANDLPTTSQPSIGDFLGVYEPLLEAGSDIVSIHLAGGMSGTVRAAEQARERLGSQAHRVHVVDSRSACGGQGLVVLAAAAAARDGADADAVAERAHRARAELKLWFAIDTLEYLRRGGRIAGAQAWLGSALKIKPILTVESEITLRSCKEDGADGWMVQHIQARAEAAELVARGVEIFGCEPVMTSEIGPVIGTHVGPGLLGAGGIPSSFL
jgi:DegV family protein with EDD domain